MTKNIQVEDFLAKSVPLLSQVEESKINKFASEFKEKRMRKDQIIIKEGEIADTFFILATVE